MPPVIRPKTRGPRVVHVPERVAIALEPSIERGPIPSRVTMRASAPPFAGELREEASSPAFTTPLAVDQFLTLATLRRPWLYVGFIVKVGNAAVPVAPRRGLVAFLRIKADRYNGLTQPFVIPLSATAPLAKQTQAVVNLTVGAACELVVLNETDGPVTGLAGAIWGMGER